MAARKTRPLDDYYQAYTPYAGDRRPDGTIRMEDSDTASFGEELEEYLRIEEERRSPAEKAEHRREVETRQAAVWQREQEGLREAQRLRRLRKRVRDRRRLARKQETIQERLPGPTQEFVIVDSEGERSDAALHEAILGNTAARKKMARVAIWEHIQAGRPREEALRLFLPRDIMTEDELGF